MQLAVKILVNYLEFECNKLFLIIFYSFINKIDLCMYII